MGVNASVEWTRQCIAYKHTLDSSSTTTSNQDPAAFIFDMYLLADFRILQATPLLPSTIATPHRQFLFTESGTGSSNSGGSSAGLQFGRLKGGVILQILEVSDASIGALQMLTACEAIGVAGDHIGGLQVGTALPRGMITLDLTEGVRKVKAMLMEPIQGIAMEMKLGAKIRVRDVEIRHGVLQLYSRNTLLLGGEVASLNLYPRRLMIMNQMKQRLNGINNNNVNRTSTVNSLWRNTQTAVNAQDAVASTMPQQSTTHNPWRSIQPGRYSPSPPPARQQGPDPELLGLSNDRDDEYMRMQREQEPEWDYHDDSDIDFGLPDTDMENANWDMDVEPQPQPPPRDRDTSMSSGVSSKTKATDDHWNDNEMGGGNKKRRVTPEYESTDQDFYTNRRRSRSFSALQVGEENEVKVKTERAQQKDESMYLEKQERIKEDAELRIKKEGEKAVSRSANDVLEKEFDQHDISIAAIDVSNNESMTNTAITSIQSFTKIKIEAARSIRHKGASYHAAIALSSDDENGDDDDGDNDKSNSSIGDRSAEDTHPLPDFDQDKAGSSFYAKVKLEPEAMVQIKQEETLLEFDMDDEDDFGGLNEVLYMVPDVELNAVGDAVRNGGEVKSKARVSKLGKFSLTTLAVSIPVFLLPTEKDGSEIVQGESEFRLEAILDQKVIELLMEYSVAEFRNLVRVNEHEAKQAVAKMRVRLSEVESVECLFKGLRNNIPVIREMKILSKKSR
ncbi:hypothetical protein BGZ99_010084 [Dissophora globulifera]|uniref:RecQ-mediated genome instability protein 1 n=1 Tax=Dissophora globulifera TaxID=979702 RepID=A0A9P6ULD9_9FUNG|nr:hypothetical protein BGZ99_010084 [Dissophora globulifera]